MNREVRIFKILLASRHVARILSRTGLGISQRGMNFHCSLGAKDVLTRSSLSSLTVVKHVFILV